MQKKLIKLIAFLLVLTLMPMSAFALAADGQTYTFEMKTYPFLYCFDAETKIENADEMNLYFVDGGDVPYVALTEFLPVLAELYNTSEDRDESKDIVFEVQSYLPDEDDSTFIVTRPDNNSALIIQPGDDTLIFTNFNSFSQKPDNSALVRILDIPDPDKSNDISELLMQMLQAERKGEDTTLLQMQAFMGGTAEDPAADHTLFVATNKIFNRRGQPLTMSLGDYYIDIVCKDGECYLPLQTMSDIFFTLRYCYFVFNGEKVIADVYKGSLLDQAYEAEPADMSQEFAMFNYRELCFFLDYFYGLKPEHRIDGFAEYMIDAQKLAQIQSTDPVVFDSALTEILLQYFDDSHSALVRYSWRCGVPEGMEFIALMANMGYSALVKQQAGIKLSEARNAAFPDGVPGYEEIGDTAFITFDSFDVNRSWKEYYELEYPDNPQDTIELIMYANRQVRREGSPVKNIVLDLSMNGGGNSDAAVAVASWFTGAAKISLVDTMTGAETIASYRTDLNVNGFTLSNPDGGSEKYDPGDTVAKQYNLFCLISSQSFSCGNLVPAIFEQAGDITLIGQRSGGGSNAVLPATSASGTVFQISGPLQITTFNNGSFYGVDTGVEPHVRLNFYESFYDREALVEMIHNLK
jgi:hypothetical protein